MINEVIEIIESIANKYHRGIGGTYATAFLNHQVGVADVNAELVQRGVLGKDITRKNSKSGFYLVVSGKRKANDE